MTTNPLPDRRAAFLIVVPAILSLVVMLHHPVMPPAHDQSGAALSAGINRIAASNAAFHGIVLLLISAQALGLYGFAERLGLSRLWVRAGVMLYGIATMLMFVPATIDGFVTPILSARCAQNVAFCTTGMAGSLAFAWATIQAFTKAALSLQTLGLLAWSIALIQLQGWRRAVGVAGALISTAPLLLLGTMTRPIDPVRLAEIIFFEACWSIGAAVLLWKGAVAQSQ